MLYFITGNQKKFAEMHSLLDGQVKQLTIDLPEIQEIDAYKIIRAKLETALNHHQGEFIVEDTSLYFECLNGLPGPLIKWFLQTVGLEGLADLTQKLGNQRATAKTIIGYAKSKNDIQFFEGAISGNITAPGNTESFSWDSIFQPDGHQRTFAEMTAEEKNAISMRKIAAHKLKKVL